jgi:hypothetical protein
LTIGPTACEARAAWRIVVAEDRETVERRLRPPVVEQPVGEHRVDDRRAVAAGDLPEQPPLRPLPLEEHHPLRQGDGPRRRQVRRGAGVAGWPARRREFRPPLALSRGGGDVEPVEDPGLDTLRPDHEGHVAHVGANVGVGHEGTLDELAEVGPWGGRIGGRRMGRVEPVAVPGDVRHPAGVPVTGIGTAAVVARSARRALVDDLVVDHAPAEVAAGLHVPEEGLAKRHRRLGVGDELQQVGPRHHQPQPLAAVGLLLRQAGEVRILQPARIPVVDHVLDPGEKLHVLVAHEVHGTLLLLRRRADTGREGDEHRAGECGDTIRQGGVHD